MLTIVSPQDYRDMPWRNGGGSTCELYRLPHPSRGDDFALRLSIARVEQDGPFSSFAGIDRHLLLLEGAGMCLQLADGSEWRLEQTLQPIRFAGETPIDCQLINGPLLDFNLMVARDWADASLEVIALASQEALELATEDLALVYLHRGQLQCGGQTIASQHTVLLEEASAHFTASEACCLILIRITPARPGSQQV